MAWKKHPLDALGYSLQEVMNVIKEAHQKEAADLEERLTGLVKTAALSKKVKMPVVDKEAENAAAAYLLAAALKKIP